MKTCPQCGRSYPDAQLACHLCGTRLPESAAAAAENAAHIDYLLGQLNEWVLKGWVAPTQARRLYDEYVARRATLLNPQVRPSRSAPINPTPARPSPGNPSAVPAAPSNEKQSGALAAFLEAANISLWHIVGAALLLAGVTGLVRYAWHSVGRVLVLLLMLGLTGGLYALAHSRAVRSHQITVTAFNVIAALLVPLDLVAAHAFGLVPVPLSTPALGLSIALICLPLYVRLARREPSRAFVVLVILDQTTGLHFLLQLVLPGLLHTHDALALLAVYGYVYVPLAGLYLLESRRAPTPEKHELWLLAAHVTVMTSLVLAFVGGGASAFGHAAATLLLVAVFYAGVAWMLDEAKFVLPACGLALLGSVLLVHRTGVDYAGRWYVYVLLFQALALLFGGASAGLRSLGRVSLSAAYRETMSFAAGLALVIQAVRLVAALTGFPTLDYLAGELWGTLVAAAVSLAFYARLGPVFVADGVWGYACILLGALVTRYAPADSLLHRQPNTGLWLAVASLGLLFGVRHRRSALALGGLSLCFAVLYALENDCFATTVLSLLLLTGAPAFEAVRPDEKSLFGRLGVLVEALVGATLLVLLVQSRCLPVLHTRFGWEPNAGYGLFVLAFLLLGLSLRRPAADWGSPVPAVLRWAARMLGVVDAVVQCGYALEPGFVFSPLALFGVGALASGCISLWRRSGISALWAGSLAFGAYAVFWIGDFPHGPLSPSLRETTITTLLLLAALLFFLIARQQRVGWAVYTATLAGTLGYVQALHETLVPAVTLYPLLMLPLVVVFYLAGVWRAWHASDLWPSPLRASALILSVLSLSPDAAFFFAPSNVADAARILWSLIAYGAVYVVMLAREHEIAFLYLMAALWDGAYLFELRRHAPALPPTMLGFFFSLAALFWLALATLTLLAARRRRLPTASLFHVATVVALLAVVMALTGLGGAPDRFAVYTLLVAGTVFLSNVRGLGRLFWMHLGSGSYLLAYLAFLFKRIGTPGWETTDFYLVPIGLYVLALGLLSRRRTPQASRQPFYLAGLLLVLTPTYVAARQAVAPPFHAVLLMAECVAAVFFGISARIRAFVVGGVAFLCALIGLQFQGYLTQLHWAVYATLLGLTIIASALFFENRRDDVLRWTRTVQERLRDWE